MDEMDEWTRNLTTGSKPLRVCPPLMTQPMLMWAEEEVTGLNLRNRPKTKSNPNSDSLLQGGEGNSSFSPVDGSHRKHLDSRSTFNTTYVASTHLSTSNEDLPKNNYRQLLIS